MPSVLSDLTDLCDDLGVDAQTAHYVEIIEDDVANHLIPIMKMLKVDDLEAFSCAEVDALFPEDQWDDDDAIEGDSAA